MPVGKRAVAEFFGTFWLVFGGCGAAIFAATFVTPAPGSFLPESGSWASRWRSASRS